MYRAYRMIIPILAIWLIVWTVIAWAAIQDDALIHLRYADNLRIHHFVTYDGIHQDYGASSLLYISILALLSGFIHSPNLPHALSSVVHVLLFAGLAFVVATRLPASSGLAKLAGSILLFLLVMPSAMRWLDDGMETGLVIIMVCLVALLVHGDLSRQTPTSGRYSALAFLALAAVLLRTELLMLFAFCVLILIAARSAQLGRTTALTELTLRSLWKAILDSSHILVGAALAVGIIVSTMHVLLPDTAVAKAHGFSHWKDALHQTEITLGGAASFGVGLLCFWLLTLLLVVLSARRLTLTTILANLVFPTVLILSCLRGQEIQGVRYFAWTFFFSILWNILELAQVEKQAIPLAYRFLPLYIFLALLLLALPYEVVTMHRVLRQRAETVHVFDSQHIEALQTYKGVAFDIGYIGYFSRAQICDLAGLVNGRAAASLTSKQRLSACIATNPDFFFLNTGQLSSIAEVKDIHDWQSCGHYDLVNVHSDDRHYLLVRPSLVPGVCAATGQIAVPYSVIMPAQSAT